MNKFTQAAMVVAFYNLAVLFGCAWLVHHGWSAWWFLLAFAVLKSVSECDCEKHKKSEEA